ncbi:MAG: hypothetical protein QNJ97_27490 [Myxococcota bacterium]|nr:hypothetical protein [Myxococcota bacterium]
MKEPFVVIGAAVFIAALLFRLVRSIRLGRRFKSREHRLPACADETLNALVIEAKQTGRVKESLKDLSQRALGVDASDLRAAYHCAAGHMAMTDLKRPALSVGFYLRAIREDPHCVEALDKLQEILVAQKRFRRLEWTYWEVLGRLSDAEVGGHMWTKCWSGLASVYSTSQRTVGRADAIRKVIEVCGSDVESEEDSDAAPVVRPIAQPRSTTPP